MKKLNSLAWKTIESKKVYESPWCTFRLDTVSLPNGSKIEDFSVIDLPHVVVVLALTNEGKVLLVRQYRYAVNKILVELPAGTYNPKKEDAKDAVIRELWEETGYKAEEVTQLGVIYEYPTKLTYSVTLFLAQKLTYLPTKELDVTEEIELLQLPFEDVVDLVKKGEMCVGGSVSAILLAKEWMESHVY